MAQYKTGIESKKKILDAAKALFYANGFRNTTIAMIAEKAEVPVGLVNYYYKKEALIGALHEDFVLAINAAIDLQLGAHIENHLQRHLIFNRIFYTKIFEEPRNKPIYKLLLTRDLTSVETHAFVRRSLTAIITEFDLEIRPVIFQKLMIAEYGARKSLLQDAFETFSPESSNDFIDFLATITVRLAGFDTELIDINVQKANILLKDFDASELHFLQ